MICVTVVFYYSKHCYSICYYCVVVLFVFGMKFLRAVMTDDIVCVIFIIVYYCFLCDIVTFLLLLIQCLLLWWPIHLAIYSDYCIVKHSVFIWWLLYWHWLIYWLLLYSNRYCSDCILTIVLFYSIGSSSLFILLFNITIVDILMAFSIGITIWHYCAIIILQYSADISHCLCTCYLLKQ